MGRQPEYQHCPTSPSSPGGHMMGYKSNRRWKPIVIFAVLILSFVVLFLVFLGLFLGQLHSEPAIQLQECQFQMQNQSAQAQAQATSLRKLLEEMQEAARKEARVLSHELEAMNETLVQTWKNWHSCQKQLNTLQKNVTFREAEEHTWKETIKDLQQQLSKKSLQLDNAQHEIQEERKSHQAEIQQLREQLQREQLRGSNAEDFGGPSLTLLTILAGYSLSM